MQLSFYFDQIRFLKNYNLTSRLQFLSIKTQIELKNQFFLQLIP
jgi:hypothetical protein